jgi:exodeoxyribonuclease-3
MKIISWNVNGLRSVAKHGFREWLIKSGADIVCLQETKLQAEQVPPELRDVPGYHFYGNYAEKKGYSGVAVYTKEAPKKTESSLGMKQFDDEGRMLRLDYGDFIFIGCYIPHGGREKEKLGYKLEVYSALLKYLSKIKSKNVVIAGDFNVAHTEFDLARPKENKNGIMFTPEEREQIDRLSALGFSDTFRKFHTDGGHYSWWPYYAQARERNLGWRIDYCFASGPLSSKIEKAFILPAVTGSDHCPVGIEIKGF